MLNKFLPLRLRALSALPADDVIDNNGAPDAIASDVARLHAQYLTFAAQAVAQEKP
jgi:dephospho-CoA kinase